MSAAVVGYLVGTVPVAQMVARRLTGGAVDPLSQGSGNPGTANMTKLAGRRAGAVVFAGDVAKGVVAGRLGAGVAGPSGVHIASTAAIVGHCFPAMRPGEGGKGVATSIGQVAVSFPAYLPIDMAVAGATYYLAPLRRDARLATTVASLSWVTCGLLWWRRRWPNLWGPEPTASLAASSAASAAVIALRFRQTAASSANRGDAMKESPV